jgi:Trypsin
MVMGGSLVTPGDASFVVALRMNVDQQAFSSGSIVGAKWIMTARHSLFYGDGSFIPFANYKIWTGTKGPYAKRQIDGKGYTIKNWADSVKWDVVLLELNEPIEAPAAPIALDPTKILVDTTAWVAGWGFTSPLHQRLPYNLQKIKVTTSYACSTDDFLCTPGVFGTPRLEPPGGGSLSGDSGGPLYTDGPNPSLIGVISGNDIEGKKPPPHTKDARVHTRVSAVYNWARQYIG